MRKLLIVNGLIFILGYTFLISNAMMYDFIYFPVMQSAFTRIWFLKASIISLFICIVLAIVLRYQYKSIKEITIKRIVDYEIVLLYFVGLLIAIHYTYIVFYPYNSSIILIEMLVHYDDFTHLVTWYIFEGLIMLLLLIKKIVVISRTINQHLK